VISLALGVVLALIAAMAMLRPPAAAPIHEARRLLDSVGWAAILPQLLAALGAVFALAGSAGRWERSPVPGCRWTIASPWSRPMGSA